MRNLEIPIPDEQSLGEFFSLNWRSRPSSSFESVSLALEPGRTYDFYDPIHIDCGTLGNTFCLLLNGSRARLRWMGGKGRGPAITIGGDNQANDSQFENFYLICGPKGGDVGILLENGKGCDLRNVTVTGTYKARWGTAIELEGQQSLGLHNVDCSFADYGLTCGRTVNTTVVTIGKFFECEVGMVLDGTGWTLIRPDFSRCRKHALHLTRASNVTAEIYTEDIGPVERDSEGNILRDERGNTFPIAAAEDSAVVLIEDSECVKINGSLNAKRGGPDRSGQFISSLNLAYAVDVHRSRSVEIGNAEAMAVQKDIYREDVYGSVTSCAAVRKMSRWDPLAPRPIA